jgi:3-mercaptopyruvate sulfurtransferase SseA
MRWSVLVFPLWFSVGCAPLPTAPDAGLSPIGFGVRSAANLDDNRSGSVTAARLQTWLSDWAAQRPEGLTGDLVILQLSPASRGGRYVAPQPGVRVYDAVDLDMFVEPRNNGLAAIGRAPANGVRVDRLLRAYGVRPDVDFLLLTQGEATRGGLETLARTWLTLRYWGVPHTAMGVLRDPISEAVPTSARTDTVAAHPFSGTLRVSSLGLEGRVLVAGLSDVRDAIGKAGIVDVRAAAEFDGLEFGSAPTDSTCLAGAPRCAPTFSGHIAGAVNLPVERVVEGSRLKSLEELDAVAAGFDRNAPVIVYATDDGASAVVTFALVGVVGLSARWYAGGFIEWGALNASHPVAALRVLPEASAWRTDTDQWTGGERRWADADRAVRPLVFDPMVAAVDRVTQTDADYPVNPPELPAPGAGIQDCR